MAHFTVFMRVFFLSLVFTIAFPFVLSSCGSEDEGTVRASASLMTPQRYESGILGTRTDMGYFLEIDSLRGKMLFADSHKRCVVSIDGMNDAAVQMVDMRMFAPDFGKINSLKALPDATWLLTESRDSLPMRFWKVDPDAQEARHVFTMRNIYQTFRPEWGYEYARDLQTIFISEYGNSANNPIDPEDPEGKAPLGYKAGATKVWKSEDMGATWQELVDFRTFPDVYYERLHVHALHYDQQRHRLYASTGDHVKKGEGSDKKIFLTDDFKTWKWRDWKFYWGDTNDAFSHGQVVSFYVAENFIVAGGDDYNNCIYRINLSETPEDMQMEIVYRYNPDVYGIITQYAQRFLRLDNGMIVTLLTGGDGNGFPRQVRVAGTFDGYKWYELFKGQEESKTQYFANMNTLAYWNHRLYFSCQQIMDGTVRNVFYEMAEPGILPESGIAPVAIRQGQPGEVYDLLGHPARKINSGIVVSKGVKMLEK